MMTSNKTMNVSPARRDAASILASLHTDTDTDLSVGVGGAVVLPPKHIPRKQDDLDHLLLLARDGEKNESTCSPVVDQIKQKLPRVTLDLTLAAAVDEENDRHIMSPPLTLESFYPHKFGGKKRRATIFRKKRSTGGSVISATSGSGGNTNKFTIGVGGKAIKLALDVADEKANLNETHQLVRSQCLRIFVEEKDEDDAAPSTTTKKAKKRRNATTRKATPRRVGLVCAFCKDADDNIATMQSFFPKTLDDIYFKTCVFQRTHLKTCSHCPATVLDEYNRTKVEDRSHGRVAYWKESAKKIGLKDVGRSGGIQFASK